MSFRINEGFDSVRHGIEGVKYVEESWARWQHEIFPEHIDTSNRHEHTNWATKSEKGTWVKV